MTTHLSAVQSRDDARNIIEEAVREALAGHIGEVRAAAVAGAATAPAYVMIADEPIWERVSEVVRQLRLVPRIMLRVSGDVDEEALNLRGMIEDALTDATVNVEVEAGRAREKQLAEEHGLLPMPSHVERCV